MQSNSKVVSKKKQNKQKTGLKDTLLYVKRHWQLYVVFLLPALLLTLIFKYVPFDRGRCVVTAVAKNPALVCAWLDQMYAPMQSPQNNWGTYGESDDFDIFVLGKNEAGEEMLQHAPLGSASPVEVREAECVGGPLAILDEYYGVYVTCPDDAQYRLDWIKEIYTPDMHTKYVYPNVFMSQEDTEKLSDLQADIQKTINAKKADWIMNGFTDADWDAYIKELDAYGMEEYLSIFQKYLDNFYEN